MINPVTIIAMGIMGDMVSEKELKPSVVLVADRTLSADYKVLFEGIFATMQTTKVPSLAMRNFVARKVRTDSQGRAHTAPLGLRRVESSLMKYTSLSPDDVVCTTPERLKSLIGPWTKIVMVSSSDPLGHGMSNTTTTSFWEGELYTRRWMRQMLEWIYAEKIKYGFTVIGGGAGAWQWEMYPDPVADKCIDYVYEGYFESRGPGLVDDILAGRKMPGHIVETKTAAELICPIRHASLLGIVEISRGCGRGCRFCSMADKKMSHLPVDLICADLETNVSNGITSVVSGSEDFFRYGADSVRPDYDKLYDLLENMRRVKGLSFMQIDHANISTVAQMTDRQLIEVRKLLSWDKRCDYLWVNMGLESANGNLVAENCRGKISPYQPDQWADIVKQVAEKMTKTGFYSVFSLVLGLPGETPDDIAMTMKLVKYLEKQDAVIFPVFYEPYRKDEIIQDKGFSIASMTAEHLELYRKCYEINFKRVPKLFWDNQTAASVSWFKRALMQALGKTEVVAWRRKFNSVGRQISARTHNQRARNAG